MDLRDTHYIGLSELLRRGEAEVLWEDGDAVLLRPSGSADVLLTGAATPASADRLCDAITALGLTPGDMFCHEEHTRERLRRRFGLERCRTFLNLVYPSARRLPLPGDCVVSLLTLDYAPKIAALYEAVPFPDYFAGRICAGRCFGAFLRGEWAAFGGFHEEGTMGFLHVLPAFRGRGVGTALLSYLVDYCLERGWTPLSQVDPQNAASLAIHRKLGFVTDGRLCRWLHE